MFGRSNKARYCTGSGPPTPYILRLVLDAKLDRSSFELGYMIDERPHSYDPMRLERYRGMRNNDLDRSSPLTDGSDYSVS